MKKKILLPLFLLFAVFAKGQMCGFTHSPAGALGVVSFTPTSPLSSPPYYFQWDFGDGTYSSDSTPVHSYNSASGFVRVCLTLTDSNQTQICQFCDSISLSSGSCSFSAFQVPPASGLFNFSAQVSAGTYVNWNFGDGGTGTGSQISHTYTANGVYTVVMNQVDTNGNVLCTSYHVVYPTVTSVASCDFTAIRDSLNGFLFSFHANVTSGSTVSWDFGDNSTAGTGLYVTHTYNSTGPFIVTMTSVDTNGTPCTYTATVSPGGVFGNCSFSYAPDSANPNTISFTGYHSSPPPATGFSWNFGDGTSGQQGDTITHTYSASGTYLVCMDEYAFGAIVCTSCSYVTVNINTPPGCQSYFMAANVGLTSYFIDLSNVNSSTATYTWDFGDSTSSNSRFTSHAYNTPGTYNVCLTIANNGCTSTYCLPLTVDTTINNPGTTCHASFVILQIAPFQFTVVNLSSGTNLNFNWDFGDATTSSQAYPSHYYNAIGSYNLCLNISNSTCSDMYCDTLNVDSSGNVFRSTNGFTVNVMSPAMLIGVQEISVKKLFSVYPNPVTSSLTVSLTSDVKGVVVYKVYAVDGTEVTNGTFTKTENKLNTGNWKQGAYIIEVSDAQGFRSYQKIIKE